MAGSSLIGNLAILLSMDTAAFEKGNTHAQKLLKSTQRQFENVAKKMYGIGQTLSLSVTAPLVAFGGVAVREATEAAAAMGQVEAALKSMGPVAGKTATQLKKAADAFETQSLFEADEILKKVTANLLTFGNVSGQAFDRAQQAAINMSARLGQDLQSSAIQVGKALNDPIKGMTALSRVGVQFTAQQKEQIKAFVEGGQAAKAQGIILAELERQFGGAALAAQNTDPFNKAADAFRQMAEQVGTALLPVIPVFTNAIVSLANAFASLSPATQKWVIIAAAAAAALGPLLVVLGALISAAGVMLPLILKLGPAFVLLKASFLAVTAASGPLLASLLPILGPLVAIAAAVGAVYLAWKNWDKIAPIVGRMVSGVNGWLGKLNFNRLKGQIETVTSWFRGMYDKVVGNSYVPDMVDEIAVQMQRLDAVMVAPVAAATSKTAEAFRQLQEKTKGLLDRLFPEEAAFNVFKTELASLEAAMKAGILTATQYAAALERLQMEGLTDVPILEGADQPLAIMGPNDDILASLYEIPEAASAANDALKNVAHQGLTTLADGLAAVVMGTAKLGEVFKVVAQQIIADLIRIQIQKMITNLIGSIGGAGGLGGLFGGARAKGGPVVRGKAYLVGENGPELFAPGSSGRVIANDNMGAGGGAPFVFNNYAKMSDREARQTGMQAASAYRQESARSAKIGV